MKRPTSVDDLRFFDSRGEIACGKSRLPHWQQDGCVVYISFRLGDSIPQSRLREWAAQRSDWLARNRPPLSSQQEREYHELFTATMEDWCDKGWGSCVLQDPALRAIVGASLNHAEGERCWQHAWIVMPNHVHALCSMRGRYATSDVVQGWKGYSAREINRVLGKRGNFWMKDYFDRLVRDAAHFWRCARYIRSNPLKAGLTPGQFTLFEAPFVREWLDAESGKGRMTRLG